MVPPKGRSAASTSSQRANDNLPEDDETDLGTNTPPSTLSEILELLKRQQEEIGRLNSRLEAQEAQESTATPPANEEPPKDQPEEKRRDPKVDLPTPFGGKTSEFRNFKAQYTLVLTMCPNTYDTEVRKVLFVVSRLQGTALSKMRSIISDINHPLRNNFQKFEEELMRLYSDKNLVQTARNKITRLKQEKSARAYFIDFENIIEPLNLPDEAKIPYFYRGLKGDVKDSMAIVGQSDTYEGLVDQAIEIDERNHLRRLELKEANSSTSSNPKSNQSQGQSQSQSQSQNR